MKIRLLLALVGLALGFTVPTFAQQKDTDANADQHDKILVAIAHGPPESEQAKQIEALVEKASGLIERKGKAIFPEFRKTGGEWRMGNTYLFIADLKGVTLFNAGFPEREGTNTSNSKDANGKVFSAEFVKVVQ